MVMTLDWGQLPAKIQGTGTAVSSAEGRFNKEHAARVNREAASIIIAQVNASEVPANGVVVARAETYAAPNVPTVNTRPFGNDIG